MVYNRGKKLIERRDDLKRSSIVSIEARRKVNKARSIGYYLECKQLENQAESMQYLIYCAVKGEWGHEEHLENEGDWRYHN